MIYLSWAADAGEQRPRPLQDVLAGPLPLEELPKRQYTAGLDDGYPLVAAKSSV